MTDESSAAPAVNEQPPVTVETTPSPAPEQAAPATEGDPGAPAAETTGEAGEEANRPKSPNKVPYQERISQLVQQRKLAEEERDLYRNRAIEAEKRLKAPSQTDPTDIAAPQQHEYASDQEYYNALARYQAAQRSSLAKTVTDTLRQEMASEAANQAEIRAQQARDAAWREGIAAKRERMPDFEAVAMSEAVPYSHVMLDLVKDSPHGHEVAYFLGKNVAEAARIAELPPLQAAVEIGKLEARLGTPAAPRFTQAPPPVKMVGSGAGAVQKSLREMSFEEYEASQNHRFKGR